MLSNHRNSPQAKLTQCHSTVYVVCLTLLTCLIASCTHGHHRGPSDIQEYIHALERPGRDEYQQPDEVIKTLNVKPGMIVADIGAGSGYFTRRFAQDVGKTVKVIAVDVEQKMLDYNQAQLARLGNSSPTEFILAKSDDPSLPKKHVDLVFLCNVFHHLENQNSYFRKVKSALAQNGRVAIIDFYHDERSGKLGFSKHHLLSREMVIKELEQAGFHLLREHTFLPRQYFLEFVIASPQ